MVSILIFGYLPMRKDTCSQWHSACLQLDLAHPTVPGASDSSAMGVSPMLSRFGSVCRATGAVLALAGLSNASASCSKAGFGGRVRPCGRYGHLLRLRRVSGLIALGVPLGICS